MHGIGRLVFGSIFIALLIAWIVWSLRIPPIEVDVTLARRGTFEEVINEEAQTKIRDRYLVSAPLTGLISRTTLRAGDPVIAGTVVAVMKPGPSPFLDARTYAELSERLGISEAALDEAQAMVERASLETRDAKDALDRSTQLLNSGATTSLQYDRQRLQVELAERAERAAILRHHAAEHALTEIRALLKQFDNKNEVEQVNVTAPIDGVVLKVLQENEGPVQIGTPLFELGNPQDLTIIAEILSTRAIRLRKGQKVRISNWGGESILDGEVSRVEPSAITKLSALGIDEQRVPVTIEFLSQPSHYIGLGDSYRVDVAIITNVQSDVMLIPTGALFRENMQDWVFIARDGFAKKVPVALMVRGPKQSAVGDKISANDPLIMYPPSDLTDGMRVRVRSKATVE